MFKLAQTEIPLEMHFFAQRGWQLYNCYELKTEPVDALQNRKSLL